MTGRRRAAESREGGPGASSPLVGWGALAAALVAGALLLPVPTSSQSPLPPIPFGPGEALQYRMVSSRFGTVGSGRMTVEGPVDVRGRSVLLLTLEVTGGVGFLRFEDVTRSWLDPGAMAALRFRKTEEHALGGRGEAVEIFPEEGVWVDGRGEEGLLMTDRPLDELSFIYLLRTLELDGDGPGMLGRHFDPERNPVRVRVASRAPVTVPAGTFAAVSVEMTVRDDRRYGEGRGRIRVDLSDDGGRIPLRIESTAPFLGRVVLELERIHGVGSERAGVAGAPVSQGDNTGPAGTRPFTSATREDR